MSISVLLTPSNPAPIYVDGATEYVFVDSYSISAYADNGSGFYRLTIGSTGAGIINVGDYVYVNTFAALNGVDSPVCQVTAKNAPGGTIDVDVAYAGALVGGAVRRMEPQDFTIDTGAGVASQPTRTFDALTVRADPDGLYRIEAKTFIISRLLFEEPSLSQSYASACQFRVYPSDTTAPAYVLGIKHTVSAGVIPPLYHVGVKNLISIIDASTYTTKTESLTGTLLNNASVTFYSFEGSECTYLFEGAGAYTTSDVSVAPALNSEIRLLEAGGKYEGLQLKAALAAGSYDYVITFDNGIDPVITWTVSIIRVEALARRTPCLGRSQFVVWWWDGWQSYSFEGAKTEDLADGNPVEVVDTSRNKYVSSIEEARRSLTLRATYEAEAVVDYLNTLPLSTEIYLADVDGSGNLTNFERVYIADPKGRRKSYDSYRPTDNVFEVTLNVSALIPTANGY